jgi:hypothetical protein
MMQGLCPVLTRSHFSHTCVVEMCDQPLTEIFDAGGDSGLLCKGKAFI